MAIYGVTDGSPAAIAGLKEGDEIVSVAGQDVDMSTEVPKLTAEHAGEEIEIVIRRDGEEQAITANIAEEDNGSGRLGIQTGQKQSGTIKATWSAPLVGVVTSAQVLWSDRVGAVGYPSQFVPRHL